MAHVHAQRKHVGGGAIEGRRCSEMERSHHGNVVEVERPRLPASNRTGRTHRQHLESVHDEERGAAQCGENNATVKQHGALQDHAQDREKPWQGHAQDRDA